MHELLAYKRKLLHHNTIRCHERIIKANKGSLLTYQYVTKLNTLLTFSD